MLEYWLWLTGRRGVGLRGLRALLEQFGTPEAVYCAAEQDYPQALRPEGRASLADKELAPARQILQQCYRKNIHVLTFQDAAYPNRLKNLDDAPLVLYYQGVFPDFDAEPVIAMVGTRKASAYGLLQAKRLGYELGRYGAIIVSGGAAGIDTMALRGAISSGTAPVAVFACGVDIDYPANNRSLFEDLRTHGCVISELPPGTPPLAEHFPPRNRILSGLALGSVVVEAPRKSGALIAINGEAGSTYKKGAPTIRSGSVVSTDGSGQKRLLIYRNGTWKVETLTNENCKSYISQGVYNSLRYQWQVITNGKATNEHDTYYHNRTVFAQISENKYIMAVGEFMPLDNMMKVLIAYGARNAFLLNGGNCSSMYVKGIGNTTGTKATQLKNLNKPCVIESEFFAANGMLGLNSAGKQKLGGPCNELDIVYIK